MDESTIVENFLETNSWHVGLDKKGAAIVLDGGGHRQPIKKVLSYWKIQKNSIDGYFPADEDTIQEVLEQLAPEPDRSTGEKSGPTQSDKRNRFRELFVEYYDSEESGSSIKIVSRKNNTGLPVSDSSIIARLRGIMLDDDFDPPSREDCRDILSTCKEDAIIQMREEKLDAIRFDPDSKFDFKSWTEKVFAYYKIHNGKLERRMFKHMMHQIKRAAFCKFTEQDFMYLFYSKVQGIGKSRLVRHVTSPFFNGLNDSATLRMLQDDNTKKALFSDAPAVIDFKEMGLGGSGSSENFAADMKAFMDAKVFKTRQMFADYLVDSYAYSVWVSSTNLRVEEVIKDTDYRRFFSFDFGLTEEDKKEYNRTNKWAEIDDFFDRTLVDAYRSLDEDKEPPLIQGERFVELCEAQASYANSVDTIKTFLSDIKYELSTTQKAGFSEITDKLIYSRYKVWAKENGYKVYNIGIMEVLIAQSVNARTHTNEDGKLCYYYRSKENLK
jgi:hypothetical protein